MSSFTENFTAKISADLAGNSTMEMDKFGWINFSIDKNEAHGFVQKLRDHYGFQFLTDLCGSHYPNREGAEFEVVYHMHNWSENVRIRIHVALSKENLEIPSLTDLFAAANWMERETFDFYGIQFSNHPNLKRILNMDDMDYHPLRKEYALEDETRDDKNNTFFGR